MREQVKWFAEEMEKTLQKNDHKGGWESCQFYYLISRLEEELKELKHEFFHGEGNLIHEATDIANFAMMIADKARKLNK